MPKPPQARPYWDHSAVKLYLGDAGSLLKRLPEKSVQCVVTSPPYWGQRKYKGADKRGALGNESTLQDYIDGLLRVFEGIWQTLRDDGTVWLNLGDCYLGGKGGSLVGLPWRVAFALQEQGWGLRQDIIWHNTSAKPDGSAHNRCVKAHEYLFLLFKQKGYYFDAYAIRNPTGSYRRSVWSLSNPGYRGDYYSAYPKKLVEPCVQAGTSSEGCCPLCGSPRCRITKKKGRLRAVKDRQAQRDRSFNWSRDGLTGSLDGKLPDVATVGWEPSCACPINTASIPCVVLDPFLGSGTTAEVCLNLGRSCIGIEISTDILQEHTIPRITRALKGELQCPKSTTVREPW